MRTAIKLLSIVVMMAAVASASNPSLINYQGSLTNGTGILQNGTFSISFRIYDVASGGSPLWTETHPAVTVANGLFTITLGSVTPFPTNLFDDSTRYLGITVGGDPELTPRTRFTSAPYALRAGYADSSSGTSPWAVSGSNVYRATGNVGVGTSSPQAAMDILSGPGRVALRVNGADPLPMLNADVEGDFVMNPHSGVNKSLRIRSYTADGVPRDHIVVTNEFAHPNIPDLELQPNGGNVGVGTESPKTALDTRGTIQARVFADYGAAVEHTGFVIGPNNDVADYGNGKLYRMRLSKPVGPAQSSALCFDEFTGFFNLDNQFVVPTSDWNQRMTLRWGNLGVGTEWPEARLHVANGDIYAGALGEEWILHTRYSTGGDFFQITDRDAYGTWKWGQGLVVHSNGNVGIGTSYPTAKLHVVGSLCVTGEKNAIVPTSKGMTKFYCEEAAESWFSDYGEVRLIDGHASVSLDPVFLEAVNIDSEHPMQVQLQEYDMTNGLVVKRSVTGFEIIEKNNGRSNGKVGFRIAAKRKGYENARLEVAGEMVAK